MKRLLYLMHVPWGWIRQRPHFLAEELGRRYEVEVIYRQPFDRRRLVANPVPPTLRVEMLNILPFNRFRWIARLNARYLNRRLRHRVRRSDVVWLTSPEMYETVERVIPPTTTVVYDCMDNQLEFAPVKNDPARRRAVAAAETRLVARADAVFVSSATLAAVLHNRYGGEGKIHVVNNGIYLGDAATGGAIPAPLREAAARGAFLVTYVGTVAEWFDTELVMETVERYPQVTMVLCGPVEIPLPRHDRILVLGPVEHRDIFPVMAASRLLVMPFRVTELVRGVDPVKLYEYIYSCKPVLAVRYGETERFADYVDLYDDRAAYFAALEKNMAAAGGRPSCEECRSFALKNTWEARASRAFELLDRP